jgi:hypothetical protein
MTAATAAKPGVLKDGKLAMINSGLVLLKNENNLAPEGNVRLWKNEPGGGACSCVNTKSMTKRRAMPLKKGNR